jgi:hypothetical protein
VGNPACARTIADPTAFDAASSRNPSCALALPHAFVCFLSLIFPPDLDLSFCHPETHDPFRFTPIHHLMIMVSYVRARPRLVVQADLARQSRGPRSHLVSEVGSR